MRVIAGKYRGKKLYSPSDECVRPTTDRIKETVFNMLQPYVEGARVLDLFAGSGALGIECLSRGASEVNFVDNNRDSIALTNANLKGIDAKYNVFQTDFLSFVKSENKAYDVVLIDAPFRKGLGEIALNTIIEKGLLADGGIAYFEHATDEKINLNLPANYVDKTKVMGTVSAEFVQKVEVGVVTGSFDPFTIGHLEIVEKALGQFGLVVVACLINPDKTYRFAPEERVKIAEESLRRVNKRAVRAVVEFSTENAVDFALSHRASALVRAMRDDADAEYEQQMTEYNLQHGMKTVMVELSGVNKDVSSTRAKAEIDNGVFDCIVPDAVKTVKQIVENKKLQQI